MTMLQMMSHPSTAELLARTTSAMDALAHEAPFLVEKLLKDRITQTVEEAEALFLEVKRYIVLVQSDPTRIWEMHSLRVDEVWHQFILFTAQYWDFCQRFLVDTSTTVRATHLRPKTR